MFTMNQGSDPWKERRTEVGKRGAPAAVKGQQAPHHPLGAPEAGAGLCHGPRARVAPPSPSQLAKVAKGDLWEPSHDSLSLVPWLVPACTERGWAAAPSPQILLSPKERPRQAAAFLLGSKGEP